MSEQWARVPVTAKVTGDQTAVDLFLSETWIGYVHLEPHMRVVTQQDGSIIVEVKA